METIIQNILKLLLDKFDAEYDQVTVSEEDGHYRASIHTAYPARLIGKGGENLGALQTLLKNILWVQNGQNTFVSVDIDNYRKNQEERIIAKVKKFIDIMNEQNLAEIKLPPMPAFFRRLIHLWVVNNHPELSTESIGEGKTRSVRLFHK